MNCKGHQTHSLRLNNGQYLKNELREITSGVAAIDSAVVQFILQVILRSQAHVMSLENH